MEWGRDGLAWIHTQDDDNTGFAMVRGTQERFQRKTKLKGGS